MDIANGTVNTYDSTTTDSSWPRPIIDQQCPNCGYCPTCGRPRGWSPIPYPTWYVGDPVHPNYHTYY